MIANVNGKIVRVLKEDGQIVRQIHCNSEAVAAYVCGDEVTVQLANGHSELYRIDGTIIRRY